MIFSSLENETLLLVVSDHTPEGGQNPPSFADDLLKTAHQIKSKLCHNLVAPLSDLA
jgi:hypothetical protein